MSHPQLAFSPYFFYPRWVSKALWTPFLGLLRTRLVSQGLTGDTTNLIVLIVAYFA